MLGFFDGLRPFSFALRLWKATENQSEWVINGCERGEGGSGGGWREPLSCGNKVNGRGFFGWLVVDKRIFSQMMKQGLTGKDKRQAKMR